MAGELVARTVEAFYSGVWNDITADVQDRGRMVAKRGVPDEGGAAGPGSVGMTLNNGTSEVNPAVSQRYSPRNPRSDLYGLIGPNTPVRLSAGLAGDTPTVRMVGEAVMWPPRFDVSVADRWVPLQTAGVLRRLGIPAAPLQSAVFREAMSPASAPFLVAYWPCEDGTDADRFASPVPGVSPLHFKPGAMQLASYSGFGGSEPLPTIAPGNQPGFDSARSFIPSYSGNFFLRILLAVPSGGFVDQAQMVSVLFTGASFTELELEYTFPPPGEGALRLRLFDADGALVDETGSIGAAVNGTQFLCSVELVQNGADIDWLLFVRKVFPDGTVQNPGHILLGTFTGQTLGTAYSIRIGGTTTDDMSFGHVMIGNSQDLVFNIADALAGWAGEPAGRRVERLCGEHEVAFTSTGDLDRSAPLGAQRPDEFLALLNEAAKAEAAGSAAPVLVEQRAAAGLHFNTLRSLYLPRTPDLELDFEQGQLVPPFDPTPDDFGLVNDATASRRDGASARVQVADGPRGIDAAGRYDKSDTFGVQSDGQLGSVAGWWTLHGTWDEDRYPVIRINVRALSLRPGGAALVAAVQTLDPGAYIRITNMPDEITSDVEQIVLGVTETISTEEWLVDLHTTPAGPFTVFVLGDPVFGRLDTAGSELALAADGAATELTVATDSGRTRWMTDAERPGDFPFAVKLGGEVVKVTAISGTVSPQTFTVERAVNGVVKPHPAGTRLRLARVAVSA